MTKTAIIISWISLLIVFGLNLWIWRGLPDLPSYPIHWNGQGIADGFGSKRQVFFNLHIIPTTMMFTFITFVFVPKLEPKKTNFLASSRPFAILWISLMIFFAFMHLFIIQNYIFMNKGADAFLFNPILGFAIGFNVLFIILGNILGKIRQTYMFGIRTPWTLSSEQAWDITHRIVGQLMVGLHVLGLISLLFVTPLQGLLIGVGLPLVSVIAAFVISYNVWKNDPDKRT